MNSQPNESSVLNWLLDGDPAIRWQVLADLQDADPAQVAAERQRVAQAGWGARLLALQTPDGQWGGGIYSPKWTSTTYTLLLLRDFGLPPETPQAQAACRLLLESGFYRDGGINFFPRTLKHSETCITGMLLSMLAVFRYPDERREALAAHLLQQQLPDGGWNCESYKGATHSSFHTTLSVMEGLWAYLQFEPAQAAAVQAAHRRGREFLLAHRLYRSHRTGEIAHPALTRFSFPPRWRYDVLRALDHFQACQAEYDPRLEDALALLRQRRQPDGTWKLQNKHPGREHFALETIGQPSRWNTLRALRVLRWWQKTAPVELFYEFPSDF